MKRVTLFTDIQQTIQEVQQKIQQLQQIEQVDLQQLQLRQQQLQQLRQIQQLIQQRQQPYPIMQALNFDPRLFYHIQQQQPFTVSNQLIGVPPTPSSENQSVKDFYAGEFDF